MEKLFSLKLMFELLISVYCLFFLQPLLAELQTQKEFVNNLSDKGKKIVQDNPRKKRETLEKLRTVGDKWKRVHRMATEKKDYLMKCISEVETFEVKYNECMEALETFSSETTEMVDTDKDISHVETSVEEVLRVGHRISSLLPENEREILEARLEKLRVTWKEMRDVRDESARVQEREVLMAEEEKALDSTNQAFALEVADFSTWLDEAENTLQIDMFSVPEEEQMDVIRKQEKLYNEIQQQSLVVSDIMAKGRKVSSRMNEKERTVVKEQLEKLSARWNKVRTLSELQGDEIERCIGEQSEYYEELEECVVWMQEASAAMAADGADASDVAGVEADLQKHGELCQEIKEKEDMVKSVMEKGTKLCDKLPPEERAAVMEQLARVKDEWTSLQQESEEKDKELRRCLGETVEDSSGSLIEDLKGCVKEIDQWTEWMKALLARAETTEERIAVLSEVETRYQELESVIVKGEEILGKVTEAPEKALLESKLLELKQDWQALKMKARSKRRRDGSQGSGVESKQVVFVGALTGLKTWLTDARDRAIGTNSAQSVDDLQEASKVCGEVRSELLDNKARFEDLMLKGKELADEWENESVENKEVVEGQLEALRTEWERLDEDLDKREDLLQVSTEQVQKLESDFEKAQSALADAESKLNDITSVENFDTVDSELQSLQGILCDVEMCEAGIASMETDGQSIHPSCQAIQEAFTTRVCELTEKLLHVKGNVSSQIQREDETLKQRDKLATELLECKELINKVESSAREELKMENILLLEEGVVLTKEAVTSAENALASLHVKTEELLSKLKPSQQAALQVEVNDLKSHWDYIGGNASDRVGSLEKRLATVKEFGQELESCKEWIENSKDEIKRAELVAGDILSMEDQVARLKAVNTGCASPENVAEVLLRKSEAFFKDVSYSERQMFESQLAELKNSVEEVQERSKVELDKLEGKLRENRVFQETYQDLKSWIENEGKLAESCSGQGDGFSVETRVEELELTQQKLESKENELKLLLENAARLTNNTDEKETIESQLSCLQNSYAEFKSKVADELILLQSESDNVKEFKAELQQCKDIVQGIESIVSSDPPCFSDIEEMEVYAEELKKEFEDALAQRSVIFQLGEKKDQVAMVVDATEDYAQVVDKWKTSLARFSEKIAETERRIALEKELNESLEEVSSWMDNVEKEISLVSEHAQEVEEVVGQVEKLKTLNNECASYEQFVETLRNKVEDSPLESEDFKVGQEDRLSSLEARVEEMHKLLAAKLGDVEDCVSDVSEVTEQISSCKEWLLQKKEMIVGGKEDFGLRNVPQLEEKLVEYQKLNSEAYTVLHDIMQAKEKVGQGVGKVSSSIEESLSKELNGLCDTLLGLHEESAAKCVQVEQCLGEVKEFQDEALRYETWLQEANNVMQRCAEKPVGLDALAEHLGELRDLQTEINEKQQEFRSFLEKNKDLVVQSGIQDKLTKASDDFDDLNKELPQALSKTEATIDKYNECSRQLEESLEWLTKAAVIVDSEATFSLDDSSAEEQLAKLKELLPELETFAAKMARIEENGEAANVVGESGMGELQSKLDSVRRKWEALKEDAAKKEQRLKAFVQAKESYTACADNCKRALDDLRKSSEEACEYSVVRGKSNAQLEARRKQQEKCQELKEQIRSLEEAGYHVTNTCEELREPIREQLKQIKNEWQKINTETAIRQEQLESWISEVGDIHGDVDACVARVKTLHDSLRSYKSEGTDIQTANEILGQLKQTASELESEKSNVDGLVEKGEMLLTKLDASEKAELEELFLALQTAFNEAERDSKERVRQAEERINDIIEFDKESARCESLLTIYQAAVPVDVSCTVETLDDQMGKLKRLYGDMESRETHMATLHEKEAKLSSDDATQSVRTTPDGKAGQLQGDWGKLKASVGEKVRELERLAQTKKDFEDDYETCQAGVQELETAILARESDRGPVEMRVERMQELCSRIKSYRNKLDLLTDRCDELPNVAYEQKDLDPKQKLNSVVKRWEEVKDEALGKLNELEKEKSEVQTLAQGVENLQHWIQDVPGPFIEKHIPPVIQKADLEKALIANTEFRSIVETKGNLLQEILLKSGNIKGDGPNKDRILSDLQDVSRTLEDTKGKLASRDGEIRGRMKQHAKLAADLDRIRDLLHEVKGLGSEPVEFEGENLIEDAITSKRVALARLDSCELLLTSIAEKIVKGGADRRDVGDTEIESDFRLLSEDVHAAQQNLSKEVLQLEKLRDFESDYVELLTLYDNLSTKICAVDCNAIAEKGDVTHTEEELAVCHAVDQELSEREGDYEALIEKEKETLYFSPLDKREELVTRSHQLKQTRTTLQELIHERIDCLRDLVAEQQTLEGWLKTAGILIKDGTSLLDKSDDGFTLDDARMSEKSQALAAFIAKFSEYEVYSETFQGSAKAPEVARVKTEISELRKQLMDVENELQQFKDYCDMFESEAVKAAAIFERCTADHQVPASLKEAQEELANVKVS